MTYTQTFLHSSYRDHLNRYRTVDEGIVHSRCHHEADRILLRGYEATSGS
jgi:hypothetical protein